MTAIALNLYAQTGFSGQWLKTMSISLPAPYTSFSDITADDFDNLYVLWWSTSAHTIQKYDKSGNPIFNFGSRLPNPTSLYSDGGGNVYVKEDILPTWPSHAIHKYSSNGTLLQTLTVNYYAPMFFVDLAGNVYVAQYTGWYSFRIHKFNPSFVETNALDVGYFPSAIQPTPSGTLYILGGSANFSEAIYEYDANLNFIRTIVPSHFSSFGGWAWIKTPHLFDWEGRIQAIASYPYSPYVPGNSNPQIFYRLDSSFNIAESQNMPLMNSPTTFDGKRLFYVAHSDSNTRTHIYQYVYDRPATAAQYVSPLGAFGTHYSSVTLSWNPSTDPDGDPVTYQVFLGTDPVHPNPLGTTSDASLPSGPLSFGATYYWQVVAQDSYSGIPLLQTQAPETSFNLNFINNPPSPFNVLTGTGTISTRDTSVLLSWQPAVDPDGDPVAYNLYWQAPSQSSATLLASISADSYTVTGLSFGTTYYWYVQAFDPFGATTTVTGGTQSYHPVFQNSPPGPFTVISGTGTVLTRISMVTLSWHPSVDPDGDPVVYAIRISTNATALATVRTSTATTFALMIQFGATYYWNVTASDPFGAQTQISSGTQSLVVRFANDPPAISDASSVQLPAGTIRTAQNSVSFQWPVYSDPQGDTITYRLYIGNSGPLALAYQGTSSSFTLTGLNFNAPYQYRVTADNPFGASTPGPSGSFMLVPNSIQNDPYSYPNPFRTGQGTNFVFSASSPVGRLKVSVYSVYQRLVWSRDFGPFNPGVYQFHWDGKDMNGQPVFSGLYVVMFDSSQGKQSIRVVGVK